MIFTFHFFKLVEDGYKLYSSKKWQKQQQQQQKVLYLPRHILARKLQHSVSVTYLPVQHIILFFFNYLFNILFEFNLPTYNTPAHNFVMGFYKSGLATCEVNVCAKREDRSLTLKLPVVVKRHSEQCSPKDLKRPSPWRAQYSSMLGPLRL